jgi:hypothetical protein
MSNSDYYRDSTGVYWYMDQQTRTWLYWDGTKWLPSASAPAGSASSRRRVDYRDRSGTYWRFFAGETHWERYDGSQWVLSTSPPPRWARSFNPLVSSGRRNNQRLLAVTSLVFGTVAVGASVAFRMAGELLVGIFFWVLGLVSGVNSLKRSTQK